MLLQVAAERKTNQGTLIDLQALGGVFDNVLGRLAHADAEDGGFVLAIVRFRVHGGIV